MPTQDFNSTADTDVDSANPNTNTGSATDLTIGKTGKSTFKKAHIRFDISSLPAGVTIAAAELHVNVVVPAAAKSYHIYRLRADDEPWTEAGDTWNKYDGTNNWTVAGGYYDTVTPTPVNFTGPTGGGLRTITGLGAHARDARDNRSNQLDLHIQLTDTSSINAFSIYTKEQASDSIFLRIEYLLPITHTVDAVVGQFAPEHTVDAKLVGQADLFSVIDQTNINDFAGDSRSAEHYWRLSDGGLVVFFMRLNRDIYYRVSRDEGRSWEDAVLFWTGTTIGGNDFGGVQVGDAFYGIVCDFDSPYEVIPIKSVYNPSTQVFTDTIGTGIGVSWKPVTPQVVWNPSTSTFHALVENLNTASQPVWTLYEFGTDLVKDREFATSNQGTTGSYRGAICLLSGASNIVGVYNQNTSFHRYTPSGGTYTESSIETGAGGGHKPEFVPYPGGKWELIYRETGAAAKVMSRIRNADDDWESAATIESEAVVQENQAVGGNETLAIVLYVMQTPDETHYYRLRRNGIWEARIVIPDTSGYEDGDLVSVEETPTLVGPHAGFHIIEHVRATSPQRLWHNLIIVPPAPYHTVDALLAVSVSQSVSVSYEALGRVPAVAVMPYEAIKGSVLQTMISPYESTQGIIQTVQSLYESRGRVARTVTPPYEAAGVVVVTVSPPYEAALGLRKTAANPIEAVQSALVTVTTPYEAARIVIAAVTSPLEALGRVPVTVAFPYEALQGILQTVQLPIESRGRVAALVAPPHEALGRVVDAALLPLESVRSIGTTVIIPWESVEALVVAAQVIIPLEALGRVTQTVISPYEVRGRVAMVGVLPYETMQQTLKALLVPYESISSVAKTVQVPYEALIAALRTALMPYEASGTSLNTLVIPYEASGRIATAIINPYESLIGVAQMGVNPIEALGRVAINVTVSYEAGGTAVVTVTIPIESAGRSLQTILAPIEALKGNILQSVISPIESLGRVMQIITAPYESAGTVIVTVAPPFESTQGLVATAVMSYEATQGIAKSVVAVYEALQGIRTTVQTAYESKGRIVVTVTAPYESISRAVSPITIPIETVQGILTAASVPFESVQDILKYAGVPFESMQSIRAAAVVPIEALQGIAATKEFPFEALQSVIAAMVAPYESMVGVAVVATAIIPYEALLGTVPFPSKGFAPSADVSPESGITTPTDSSLEGGMSTPADSSTDSGISVPADLSIDGGIIIIVETTPDSGEVVGGDE